MVIHNDSTAKSNVGVIIEAKKAGNKAEMITTEKLNAKALQELVLYYLRERVTQKNLEIKNLIITNVYEWFVFDANLFERLFAKCKKLVTQFEEFEQGRLSGNTTDFFYTEIAKPAIENVLHEIEVTYFDIRKYKKIVENADRQDDNQLIAVFKIFSPEHLLKLPFSNDSNTLEKHFYTELLHIIGLTETTSEGKKLIERNKEYQRHLGTMLEDAIIQLDSLDKINRVEKPLQYGETNQERFFNVALALCITWVNRILFLKLLEAQLLAYHKKDKAFAFLNLDTIKTYDDLNRLFFQVLARKHDERNGDIKKLFEKIPYLNSSLFEATELEHQTLFISNLSGDKQIPLLAHTILKDSSGKKRTGNLAPLEYLFEFLNAYDFSSEGSEEIQEENKKLINASVLGLIFEKINGYKDGSFFTPGMITMFMCRETLRKAVLQKFNETKKWNCKEFSELYNKIENSKEANDIINSLKICDPAVGSGHFLVSALNEIIAIKNDLKILQDKEGKRLKEYSVEAENDELIITDEDGKLFEYKPNNKESQRVQETLFHEKQTIIENCLFGVDINPNSVKICRLRLWIELLKNAYYKTPTELETLPNIDINIKMGNSLISRFTLDANLKEALRKTKISIDDYKNAVSNYKNATNKEQKHDLEKLIENIKTNFKTEISQNSKEIKELNRLKADYITKYGSEQLFATEWNKAQLKYKKELEVKIQKIEELIKEIRNNKIYETAFEWRFEFPEVLDDEGNFIGFDVVIGNPPYMQLQKNGGTLAKQFEKIGYKTFERTGDIYSLFYEKGFELLKSKGHLVFITSNKWMRAGYGESTRKFFAENTNPLLLIDFAGQKIFDAATVDTNILLLSKENNQQKTLACVVKDKVLENLSVSFIQQPFISSDSWVILSDIEKRIKEKVERIGMPLKDWDIQINYGIKTGFNDAFIIDEAKRKALIAQDPKSEEIVLPILRGRDIKRYGYEFADLYLIATFPSLKIDIEKYPAIKQHLLSFGYDRLKQTGEVGARKKTNNKWFETQDSISYWDDFSKQKIVWKRVGSILRFSYDEAGAMALDSTCFATGKHIKFLVAVLNSKMGKYLMKDSPQTGTGDLLISVQAIEPLKIPIPDTSIEKSIEKIIDSILKQENAVLQKELDQMIYAMYELNKEETKFIESQ